MISRETRRIRAELAAARKVKCYWHRVRNCENHSCRFGIANAIRKRGGKKAGRAETSPADLERLFYLIRHPQEAESYFRSIEDDLSASELVVVPVPTPVPPTSEPTDPRQLTLRQRIELAKTAA